MDDHKSKTKRRYSVKRREKAKEAARTRRDIENELYQSMISLLPLESNIIKRNYCQALRISIAFIQLCHIKQLNEQSKHHLQPIFKREAIDAEPSILEALHGFFIIVSSCGNVTFVTDTVSHSLGIPQGVILGSNLYEYVHESDVKELRSILGQEDGHGGSSSSVRFLCRLRCTLSSKGSVSNIKSAPYRVIQFIGRHVSLPSGTYVMALCQPLIHPSNIEIPLEHGTFLTRHKASMTFTYCDDRMKDLVGFTRDDVLGKSVYEYHHTADHHIITKAHQDLLSKGESVSEAYRFLAKHGGYVSIISHSTLIYHDFTQQPECVVSIYFVLSGVQCPELILSHVQVPPVKSKLPLTNSQTQNKTATIDKECDKREITKPAIVEMTKVSSSKPGGQMKENFTITRSVTSMEALLGERGPTLPKGRDMKLWNKLPKYGIFGGMKMPIGATESVLMQTTVAPLTNTRFNLPNKLNLNQPMASPPSLHKHDIEMTSPLKSVAQPSAINPLPNVEQQLDQEMTSLSPLNHKGDHIAIPTTDKESTHHHNGTLSPSLSAHNSPTSPLPLESSADMRVESPSSVYPTSSSSSQFNCSSPDLVMSQFDPDVSLCDLQTLLTRNARRAPKVAKRQARCSVLKQLLLHGTTRMHGDDYSDKSKASLSQVTSRIKTVYSPLKPVDYDVYTPTQDTLLYGQQLLDALD
uniref:Hypoxia-inducible factor 1 n=1 Tax=Macellomenia sp. TaxID=3077341 RepID=A0AA96HBQ3_9MOLL|nr:hypoxia-inducible factor 1 [Macellomenia sp.]